MGQASSSGAQRRLHPGGKLRTAHRTGGTPPAGTGLCAQNSATEFYSWKLHLAASRPRQLKEFGKAKKGVSNRSKWVSTLSVRWAIGNITFPEINEMGFIFGGPPGRERLKESFHRGQETVLPSGKSLGFGIKLSLNPGSASYWLIDYVV